MWKIWANYLLGKALKSCPKSNKSPNLVTLIVNPFRLYEATSSRAEQTMPFK